jgi:hypothetical protein
VYGSAANKTAVAMGRETELVEGDRKQWITERVTKGLAPALYASLMQHTKSSTQRIQTLRNTAEIFVARV